MVSTALADVRFIWLQVRNINGYQCFNAFPYLHGNTGCLTVNPQHANFNVHTQPAEMSTLFVL